ncbi:MAG: hypothetical protein BBJ60_12475 [Desulfobacterales bacterium S7086C20]|nr:MAG: hypothetical protein BBJ60_12475 [Desulfobacterales bacterium S7086C20]
MLSLRLINKTFIVERGEVHAVCDVSLDIEEGEFFTLLGPSGCGKSTTLRCIAGLETPTSGEISLGGGLVYSSARGSVVPVYQRDIGMVFQSYAIWPHMNVFENVAYPLKYGSSNRMKKEEIRQRVSDSLSLVHLEGMENRSATLLSGGQQQRVALARALVRNPKLLLLDEPLSNLDAKLREEMRTELCELVHRLGITAVYVTHDQLEALVMSDRIAVMHEGRLVQIANSHDIYNRPVNAFVAGFIGATNFLDGRFKRDSNKGTCGVTETPIGTLFCSAGAEFNDGQVVKIALRPETIQVEDSKDKVPSSPGKTMNVFEGDIEILDFHGDSLVIRVRVGEELIQVKTDPDQQLHVGQHVYLVVSQDHCQAVPF